MRKLKKFSVLAAAIAALTILTASSAFAGQWQKESDSSWKYKKDNGKYAVGWTSIASANGQSNDYYFDTKGIMQTGWIESNGNTYYLNRSGIMQTDRWVDSPDGSRYVGSDGAVLKDTTAPDGTKVDANGYAPSGSTSNQTATGPGRNLPAASTDEANATRIVISGVTSDSNGYYYKTVDGSKVTSQWKKINGKWYYFGADGYALTGFQTIGGKQYYFRSNGTMASNTFTVNNVRYTVDSSGAITGSKAITVSVPETRTINPDEPETFADNLTTD
ncbi:MAG: hypothetical protein Q4D90_06065 [bacterium]|nr:hypothetical protein [bacterium]